MILILTLASLMNRPGVISTHQGEAAGEHPCVLWREPLKEIPIFTFLAFLSLREREREQSKPVVMVGGRQEGREDGAEWEGLSQEVSPRIHETGSHGRD